MLMAGLVLPNPPTNPLLDAHTPLSTSCNPSTDDLPEIGLWRKKINKKFSASRRLSGLGKGNVINHKTKKEERAQRLIWNWVDHTLGTESAPTWFWPRCQMILQHCVTLHRLNSNIRRPCFVSVWSTCAGECLACCHKPSERLHY